MADNKVLNPGSGGATIATDDIAGVDHPRVKVEFGADGSATDVSSANPLPVVQTGTPGLPTGASTAVKQPALGTAGAASADVISVQGVASMTPVAVSGPLTDAQLRATPVPVSGTVTASGPLTDVQLRATAVPVSGTVTADTELPTAAALADAAANPTTSVIGAMLQCYNGTTWDRLRGDTTNGLDVDVTRVQGTVTVAGTVTASGPLTDAQLRATAVPVSGPLTDAQLRATAVPVSGTVTASGPLTDAQLRATAVPTSLATLPALVAGTALVGQVNVTPQTANGLSIFHLVSAAATNATNLKASAGQVYGWYIYNSNAAARKVAFHNTAGTPTAGASVAFAIVIPPSSAANVEFTNGIAFATGIAITTVTDLTDVGATAVALNDLVINIFWK